jgi:hypothetical protein
MALQVLKPDFDGPDNTSFLTSMAVVSLRLPVGPRVHFVAEVPLAHYGEDLPFAGGLSKNAFGNPYAGLEVRSPANRVFGELGLRLPAAPDNQASAVGAFTDLDRMDAFIEDIVPVTALLNYRYRGPTGLVARVRAGPSVWIDVGDGRSESELFLGYSGQLGYEGPMVSVSGGFSGLMIVTEEDLDVGERTLHQIGLALTGGGGRIRPGAQIRLPLDEDLNDLLDVVFGVSLTVALP